MKDVLDRIVQFAVLVIAVGLTLYLDLAGKIKQQVPTSYDAYFDSKNVVPIASSLIYLILLATLAVVSKIPFIRSFIDKKYVYSGRYLSLPHDPDILEIFDIKSGLLSMKYRLEGDRYSLTSKQCTGGWNSELLDMKPNGHLTYIYSGNTEEIDQQTNQPFRGHGYANINLRGENLNHGSGYWIDDKAGPLHRDHAKYLKLTSDIRWRLIEKQPWLYRCVWRLHWPKPSIVRVFAKLDHQTRTQPPFDRPPTPRSL